MKKFLKNQKGVTGADAVVAVAITVLFAGIIFTLAYNIYITTNSLKRSSQALSYITSTFEYVATQYYDDVTNTNIEKYINSLDTNKVSITNNTPYIAEVTVTNYNKTEGNEEKLDLVKEIKMSVTYKLGDKEQKIEMTTAKSREKLQVPNSPDLDLIETEEGQNEYAIKYESGIWKIADINDASWYNYNNGIWGTVLVTSEEKTIGDIIKKEENNNIYIWVPRFAYDENDGSNIEFLYKNTNNQIIDNEGTTKIEPTQLTTPEIFSNENGIWIEKENLTQEPYTYFENKYKLDTTKYEGKLW